MYEDAWNFCYAIPPASSNTSLEDIVVVVPTLLQMGWKDSPPFFCAATETGQDVIDRLKRVGVMAVAERKALLAPTQSLADACAVFACQGATECTSARNGARERL